MSQSWYLLSSGLGHAAENMATDEAILESVPLNAHPVLRFYGWKEPAATFGYFQRYAEIEQLTDLRPLVRRPTGGGLVRHGADWTYSLVFPPSHPWYSLSARESYERVHLWIQRAFTALGAVTALASAPLAGAPGQCFAGAEQFDVLSGGRKIAGAAQRRNRDGLLIQGSVQLPLDLQRERWEAVVCSSGPPGEESTWTKLSPSQEFERRVRELTVEKYSRSAYNQKK